MHVLYHQDGVLIVAKPAGLLVHRNAEAPNADAALQRARKLAKTHVFPIHRLDRAASGCLLFATEQRLASVLQASLSSESAKKRYLAFVRGEWKRGADPVVVDNPMADDNGILKDALSVVRCIGASAEPRCSLLVVEPRTGRFHQVRRHVRDLDHPVIGDSKHGNSKINRWWRDEMGFGRLGLHALSMRIEVEGRVIEVTCPLFEDTKPTLERMPWWGAALEAEPELGLPPITAGI